MDASKPRLGRYINLSQAMGSPARASIGAELRVRETVLAVPIWYTAVNLVAVATNLNAAVHPVSGVLVLKRVLKRNPKGVGALKKDLQMSPKEVGDLVSLWRAQHVGAHSAPVVAALKRALKMNPNPKMPNYSGPLTKVLHTGYSALVVAGLKDLQLDPNGVG